MLQMLQDDEGLPGAPDAYTPVLQDDEGERQRALQVVEGERQRALQDDEEEGERVLGCSRYAEETEFAYHATALVACVDVVVAAGHCAEPRPDT